MEKESCFSSSGLFSHPDKLLENHTQAVTNLALSALESNPSTLIEKEILGKVVEIVAKCHDLGKATSYFQRYITAKTHAEKEKLKSRKSSHALFGSVVAYFLTKELLQREEKYGGLFRFVPIAAFLVCKRHHGNLGDVYNSEIVFEDGDISLLQEQLESIDKEKFTILLENLRNPFSYEWLNERFSRIKESSYEMQDELDALLLKENYDYYFLIHLIYSFLLDADKNEVAVSEKDREEIANTESKINISHEIVNSYKQRQNWGNKDIDGLREQAFQEVLSHEINLDCKIYSINLPTGLGKTLTSLAFALKLREKIKEKREYTPRIIYSLPFLSVIDQNCKVFEDVLKTSGVQPLSSVLLKHHHLADTNFTWKTEEEDFEFDASNILIEGWNSEIIVTTFIQLFHTLISNKNRSIRKFHRITGSIVILDEVQAIPHKYWLLMSDIIRYMAEKFNTYFIFVTATEPLIFKRGETVSLIEREKYFESLNRVTLKPDITKSKTVKEFANLVIPEVMESQKRFLFIFNTIGSAKEFYNLLGENGLEKEEMTYLSTHVIPKERLGRIAEIRERKKRIAVTTQLVEAGVDIDFDFVYRDFCPLDSINQSAGRCNRNGISAGGVIRVVRLKDEKTGRDYATYVYNKNSLLLDITRKVLYNMEEIGESGFLKLIDEYYGLIADAKSDGKSREIIEAFYKLNYDGDNGIWAFRLIEEDYEKVDVFVQFDDSALNIWENFLKIREIQNPFERRRSFEKIKAKFYEYLVSLPKREGLNLPAIDEGMPFVSVNQIKEYYDLETGYKLKGGVAIW